MLRRLLDGRDPSTYCLISRQNYSPEVFSGDQTDRLPAHYYHLARDISIRGPLGWRLIFDFMTVPAALVLRAIRIAGIARRESIHSIVACTGDLLDLPAGFLASRLIGAPFFAYLFDDYVYQWSDSAARRTANRFAKWIMRGAIGVIAPNEFLRDDYKMRYGIECTIIRNPGFASNVDELPDYETDDNGEVRIVYTGAVYHAHFDAFHRLLDAIAILGRSDIKLHLYTAQTQEELIQHGLAGPLVLHDHLPSTEIAKVQRQADILFLPLAFDSPIPEVIRTSAPGKMGEYLGAGRPILVHAPPDSYVSWYFQKHQCGLVVDQPDSDLLAKALIRIVDDSECVRRMVANAHERSATDYSLKAARHNFLKLLNIAENG